MDFLGFETTPLSYHMVWDFKKDVARIPIEKENRTYEIAGLKVNFDIHLQRLLVRLIFFH